MDEIKLPPMFGKVFESVSLMEFKGIVRLRFNIHADNLEPGAVVAHPGTPGTAKEIKAAFHFDFL